jgi:hypothetical protein
MKMWGCALNDPRITELDPVQKMWMYENWIADQSDKAELAKNHAYLLASFYNPEGVKQALGLSENSEKISDEEFEESSKFIRKPIKNKGQNKSKRKNRRLLK